MADGSERELDKILNDISVERLEEYVSKIDDAERREGDFVGDGWELTLTPLEPMRKGFMTMKRVRFLLRGRDEAVERVWTALEYKLLRGGA